MADSNGSTLFNGPLIRLASARDRFTLLGVTVDVLATGDETGGSWGLVDYMAPANFRGPGAHYHKQLTETFYVISGRLMFDLSGKMQELTVGDLVIVPPKEVHAFSNPFDEGARLLIHFSPAGFERYFAELAALVAGSSGWPLSDPTPLDKLASKYDTFAAT